MLEEPDMSSAPLLTNVTSFQLQQRCLQVHYLCWLAVVFQYKLVCLCCHPSHTLVVIRSLSTLMPKVHLWLVQYDFALSAAPRIICLATNVARGYYL
jgi:hypothetical protein